jgi:hypothetical protein
LLLNDNSRLRGPWFDSLDWLSDVWVPQAARQSLRYVAYVAQTDCPNDILSSRLLSTLPFELQIFTNLKEKALGHAGVYGHDALERYGPTLLKVWKIILGATDLNAPKLVPKKPQNIPKLTGSGMLFRPIKRE